MTSVPGWLHTAWAVAGCLTFLGGACWIIGIFWPALREQLAFIRESRREMAASIRDREEMVKALADLRASVGDLKTFKADAQPVLDKAKDIVDRLDQYDWETAVTKGKKFFEFADEWASKLTPERIKRGGERLNTAIGILSKVGQWVNVAPPKNGIGKG